MEVENISTVKLKRMMGKLEKNIYIQVLGVYIIFAKLTIQFDEIDKITDDKQLYNTIH